MKLFDHLSVFRSRGKLKVEHYKEVLREHVCISIYIDRIPPPPLISLFPFFQQKSSYPLVLASSAVARHTVNMVGELLLMRVVLKPCGSPFPLLIFGIYSAFVILPVYFLYLDESPCG